MTWNIGPLELPIDPQSVVRRVARKQTVDQVIQQLPFAVDLGPDMYEVTLTGLIWPTVKVFALWELVKKGEQPTIEIRTDDPDFSIYNARYAINKAEEGVPGPQFIADAGFVNGVGPVHNYNITFIQFGDSGLVADGNTGDLELDDDGVGLGDINLDFGNFNFSDFTFSLGDLFFG